MKALPHELTILREQFGRLLVLLLWAHVPVLGLAAAWNGRMSPTTAMLVGAVIAALYQAIRQKFRTTAPARYMGAVLLIAEPALLLLLFAGHPWQMDMHMYFFAILALNIAWFDRRAIILAAGIIALHHLLLLYLLPTAVFPGQGDLPRVLLHAVIVLFQAAVLVWVSDMVTRSVKHISLMSNELLAKGRALEERTREAESANKAKGMFLANMSHEIRTPINAILGFCHLVQRTALDPKQRDYVSKINTAGVSLLRLINDILDFSKIEENKLTLESHPFDLRVAVASQIQLVSESFRDKGLKIDLHVDEQVPSVLIGDELRLNQVILNLLSNAIKFSERGTITMRVTQVEHADGNAVIECSVSDNGIGMTADQVGRLFTPFTQADSSTTRRFGGTGLGLAISQQIVAQMGGWIRAESLPDVGSRFTFQVHLGIDPVSPTVIFEPSDSIRRQRVFVADDNPATLQIIAEMFGRWNMRVDLAGSGQDVLTLAEREALAGRFYDLLLIDWNMPGMDGLQTVRSLRANTAIQRHPDVILMTAYDMADVINAARDDDIRAFICKPVTAENLLQAIDRPIAIAQAPVAISRELTPPQPAPALTAPDGRVRQRVLLVEDNDINREIAIELLTSAGFDVDCAVNGAIACDKVAEHGTSYDAVLMDVQMPVLDGINATRKIRRHHAAADLPIIAMTAHAYPEERQRCLDAGMNDHLAKPVDPNLLLQTLRNWIPLPRPHGSALPDRLPPFDLPVALARLDGKVALLRKLITDFGQRYAESHQELSNLIMEGRFDDARRLAHNLKGLGGTLAVDRLPQAAAAIEDRLTTDPQDNFDTLLEELFVALQPAIHAARSLETEIADDHRIATAADGTGISPDREAVLAACDLLRQQVARQSLTAASGFVDLALALGLDREMTANHPLNRALQRLDYAAALPLVDAIMAQVRLDAAA